MRPISRAGKRIPENELTIDADIHNAWHTLFGNLLMDEAIILIEHLWQDKSGRIQEKYLIGEPINGKKNQNKDKRLFAWKTIFGDTRSVNDAIRIIKKIFIKRT